MMISRRVPTRHVHSRFLIQILDHRPCGGALAENLACHTFRQPPLGCDGRFRAPSRIRPERRRCPRTWLYRVADQHRRRRRVLRPVHVPFRLSHRLLSHGIVRYLSMTNNMRRPTLMKPSRIHFHGRDILPRCVHSPGEGVLMRNTGSPRHARTGSTTRNTTQHLLDPIHLRQHAVHQHGLGLLGQARRFAYGRALLQQRNMVQRCLRLRHRQREQVDHALQAQRLLLHVRLGITTRAPVRRPRANIPGRSTLCATRTRHRRTV